MSRNIIKSVQRRYAVTLSVNYALVTTDAEPCDAIICTNLSSSVVMHLAIVNKGTTAPTTIDYYVPTASTVTLELNGTTMDLYAKSASVTPDAQFKKVLYSTE